MDKMRKGGLRLLLAGLSAGMVGIVWPLHSAGKERLIIAISLLAVFFCPFLIIGGAIMLRYGDALEGIMGPVFSEERKTKGRTFALICSIPGGLLVLAVVWALHHHGYHF